MYVYSSLSTLSICNRNLLTTIRPWLQKSRLQPFVSSFYRSFPSVIFSLTILYLLYISLIYSRIPIPTLTNRYLLPLRILGFPSYSSIISYSLSTNIRIIPFIRTIRLIKVWIETNGIYWHSILLSNRLNLRVTFIRTFLLYLNRMPKGNENDTKNRTVGILYPYVWILRVLINQLLERPLP